MRKIQVRRVQVDGAVLPQGDIMVTFSKKVIVKHITPR
jgi:hypothetical protein